MLRQNLQVGRLLRRQFLQIAANRQPAQGGRIAGRLFLVAEKLGHLAVEAAVVVPLPQPVQQALQRHDDLLLMLARTCQVRFALGVARGERGPRLQADQRAFDGRRQLDADGGKVFALEAIELGQQSFQETLEIEVVDAIVLQVGQQAQHEHGQSVAAAGQAPHDLALVELRGLQATDVGLLQAPCLMQPDLEFVDLVAGIALELQQAGQFRQKLALPHGHPLQQLVGRDDASRPADRCGRSANDSRRPPHGRSIACRAKAEGRAGIRQG